MRLRLRIVGAVLGHLYNGWAARQSAPEFAERMGVLTATGLIVGRMLVRPDWDRPRVVGTIAAAQMLGHLIKIVGFALAGTALLQRPALAAGMCLAAIAGTAIGTRFGDRLPEARFRAAFRIVLVVLAAQLLIDGIIQAWKPF